MAQAEIRVFPARAGMSRDAQHLLNPSPRVPRASGDEPDSFLDSSL